MPFVADDLAAWLVSLHADAGRKRLTELILGPAQERALQQAATAAIWLVAGQLCPEGGEPAEELAMVIGQVFTKPVPDDRSQPTVLEALQSGIARQLAVLGDPDRTGTARSSADVLGLSAAALAQELSSQLIREILVRGSRGGPLEPLATQLNHDVTQLQSRKIEALVGQLAAQVEQTFARLEAGRAAPVTAGIRCSLPADNAVFTGRDAELSRIRELADETVANAGLVAVYPIDGMPGVGKTALAVHAAHLLRPLFPDRQFFINLRAHTPGHNPVPPETALATLLAATGADITQLPEDLEGRAGLWRDQVAGQRILLVLDNAASSAQVAPLLPGSGGSLVLVTSRRQLADLPRAAQTALLRVLSPDEARQMFLRLAPRAAASPAGVIAKLMRLAGYLPLAISLLARAYGRHSSWDLADLTAETEARLLTLAAENDSIGAAFEVSYQHLDSPSQQLFRLLSLHPGTSFDAYAAAALAGTDQRLAGERLDALHGECLLTETGYRRYGMHDLLRQFARDRAAAEPVAEAEQALARLLDYYQYAGAVASARLTRLPRESCPLGAVPAPAAVPVLADASGALEWTRAERANLIACLDYATQTHQHARIGRLTVALAALLTLDGPWKTAAGRHAAAAQSARQIGDRPGQADALTELGVVRRLDGDLAGAALALAEALAIYRDLGDRLGQARALSWIAEVRLLSGDYPAAVTALEQPFGIYTETGDKRALADVLSSLGKHWRAWVAAPGRPATPTMRRLACGRHGGSW